MVLMEEIRLSDDRRGFVLYPSGRPFTPWGFNYDHDGRGRLLEEYWETEWDKVEEDFREMKELGANVVRIHLQFGRFVETPGRMNGKNLNRLGRLLELAEETGLYLDITGLGCYLKEEVPSWYDALSEKERWEAQARFWEGVSARCAGSPAIFCYDLMNEPVVPGGGRNPGDWLGPPFAEKYHFVQFVSLDAAGRSRPAVAKEWIQTLTRAVRKRDPRHLVTAGLVDWSLDRPGLASGFVPEEVATELDFLCVHQYPETGKLEEALGTLKGFSVGKPVVIEELFPMHCSVPELERFVESSRPTASGWIGFYWGERGDPFMEGWLALFRRAGLSEKGVRVTFERLLEEMTDLERLAEFPEPSYVCRQFSSFDRRSVDPSVLTDENWFANFDAGHHLRTEERGGRLEHVLMDAPGPGAVVRIWSANPDKAGIVRIYLDEAAEPVIEAPWVEILKGERFPFLEPISGERSKGWNSYLPIPYAGHCKITSSEPGFYYQINYRTYPAGTPVETYTSAIAREQELKLRRVSGQLRGAVAALPEGLHLLRFDESLAPGTHWERELAGPSAVHRLICRWENLPFEQSLRSSVLEIFFDGQERPSVEAPLGDFFATAPGLNRYRSLPSGVDADGTLYGNWVMPFADSARIRITNRGARPVALSWTIGWKAYEWTDRSMYFHAKWRTQQDLPTRPRRDWPFLRCEGKGRFVGDMLHVVNPVLAWWGEGDEKIYVDSEAFPSHFGTGSEDYFGYAWGDTALFTHAYHNQPRSGGPGTYGHTCLSRFHLMDDIPFERSFRFDLEVWHWADCRMGLSATSYWYARPGGTDFFEPLQPEDLRVVDPPPIWRAQGAVEGESLRIVSYQSGKLQVDPVGLSWSGGQQMKWSNGRPGDAIELELSVQEEGTYEVRAVFTRGRGYGKAQVAFNGVLAQEPMDGSSDRPPVPSPVQSLGVFDLRKGENRLTVKMLEEKAFGLDYLLLTKR
jgi:hypothetical protein